MNLVKTQNEVCIICYCNENFTLKCADKYCNTRICEECFETYLTHCLSEKSLVKCLNNHCKSYIISDSFKKGNNYHELYKKVLLAAFMHSQGAEVKDKINVSKLVGDLRKQRKQFIKTFPKAIELVIDIALNKKLNNIGKHNKLYVQNLVTKSNRMCMNSHCNGKMNQEFECLKCATKFCKECEKILKENHTCTKEDLDSLKLISEIPKCPKCHIAIERSEGCNGMTCASCQTTFDYSTGQASDHGSHNVIISKPKTKFKFDFKQLYPEEISKRLFIIENNEPTEPSIIMLNNVIQKLLIQQEEILIRKEQTGEIIAQSEENIIVENDVLKTFEKHLKSKLSYINFINVTIYVSELHQTDKLTMFELDDIVTKNGW
jgi:hypothetical protein